LFGRSNVRLRDDCFFITRTPPPVAALWLYDACLCRRDRNGALWIFPECALAIMSCFLIPAGEAPKSRLVKSRAPGGAPKAPSAALRRMRLGDANLIRATHRFNSLALR
jgi:hypothetical protein